MSFQGIGKIQPRSLPFPYSRVEDYEAVLKQPLGLEWNMEKMRDELCKPAVVVEVSFIIFYSFIEHENYVETKRRRREP